MQKNIVLLFLTIITSFSSLAQKEDPRFAEGKTLLPFGVRESIDSKSLSEKRILNIYLPQAYHPDSTMTYPVIYVLDGSAHEDFPHIAGLAQFMNMYELLPKSIVVGIENVDRYRDFTHPSSDTLDQRDLPTQGGSAAFIQFLAQEVQPFIRSNYHTNGYRAIIGQSMGGLLASEVLLTQPALFDDYIIVSPSLWWDNQSLVNRAADIFKAAPELKKRIVIAIGTEHPAMHEVANKLVYAIQESANANIELHYEHLPAESHATILHRAVYLAFERLYPKDKSENK
jgi:predicted alpha/beta superfamily hydrolase